LESDLCKLSTQLIVRDSCRAVEFIASEEQRPPN
jgi:hypothetical protein